MVYVIEKPIYSKVTSRLKSSSTIYQNYYQAEMAMGRSCERSAPEHDGRTTPNRGGREWLDTGGIG